MKEFPGFSFSASISDQMPEPVGFTSNLHLEFIPLLLMSTAAVLGQALFVAFEKYKDLSVLASILLISSLPS